MNRKWTLAALFVACLTVAMTLSLRADPTTEPTTDQSSAPASAPAPMTPPDASIEPVSTEPASQPAAEPATEPATEPVVESTMQPATEPATQPAAAAEPISKEEQKARDLLAERFVEMSKTLLLDFKIVPPVIQQSNALVEAAARLKPTDPRILRLLIESRFQNLATEDSRTAARDAIVRYLGVVPADEIAQSRLIDLSARDLQTADRKIAYLKSVVAADSVPATVRSHAAMMLASVCEERGQDSDEDEAIENAIKLNPLNAPAQRLNYQRRAAASPPAHRVAMLLALLRANPLQPDVMSSIAHELSDEGLLDPAMAWYASSFNLSNRMGRGLNMHDFLDHAALLIVAGQPRDALPDAEKILAADPGNADAAFVKLLATKRMSTPGVEPDPTVAAESAVLDACLRRLSDLHTKITPAAADAATPAAAPAPVADAAPPPAPTLDAVNEFLAADVQKLKQGSDRATFEGYIGGMARLAWFELYFRRDSAAASKSIEALRSLLSDSDATVTRLDGWNFLVQGKFDEARTKLTAVAERDPLSKLGAIEVMEREKFPATGPATGPASGLDALDPSHPGGSDNSDAIKQLSRLAGENASGVTGAILAEALRQRGARFAPAADAPELRAELEKFPKDFLNFLDKPNEFYKITAEPIDVSHSFGQPMYVNVTLQNMGDYDLSIGADGAIHPDLWFDAKLVGLISQAVDGAAYDRISQVIVLKAKTGSISQITRLDDGRLAEILPLQPVMAVPIQGSLFTNPFTVQTGVAPGPGGYRTQFTRVIERGAMPVGNPATVQAIAQTITTGTPEQRMCLGGFIATLVKGVTADQNASKDNQKLAADMAISLDRAADAHDSSPVAHGWLIFMRGLIVSDAARETAAVELLRSPNWDSRMLGLRLVQRFTPARQKAIAEKFAKADPDEVVRSYADGIARSADIAPPTTQAAPAPQSTNVLPPPEIPSPSK